MKPMAPGSIFIILIYQYFVIYFAFILLCIFIIKNTKKIILSYLSDLTLVSDREEIDNPLSRWWRGVICFVQVLGTRAQPPTGLIPWFSKTEGNTCATLLHHPFLFKGKPTHCLRGSRDFTRNSFIDLPSKCDFLR